MVSPVRTSFFSPRHIELYKLSSPEDFIFQMWCPRAVMAWDTAVLALKRALGVRSEEVRSLSGFTSLWGKSWVLISSTEEEEEESAERMALSLARPEPVWGLSSSDVRSDKAHSCAPVRGVIHTVLRARGWNCHRCVTGVSLVKLHWVKCIS